MYFGMLNNAAINLVCCCEFSVAAVAVLRRAADNARLSLADD